MKKMKNKIILKHDKSKTEEKRKEAKYSRNNVKTIFVAFLLITNSLTAADVIFNVFIKMNEYATLRILSAFFEFWGSFIIFLGYYFSHYFDCELKCNIKIFAYCFSFCGCDLLFGLIFLIVSYIFQLYSFVLYYKIRYHLENRYAGYLLYGIFIIYTLTLLCFKKFILHKIDKSKKSNERKKLVKLFI